MVTSGDACLEKLKERELGKFRKFLVEWNGGNNLDEPLFSVNSRVAGCYPHIQRV